MGTEIQAFDDESANVGFVGGFFDGGFDKCCFKEQSSVRMVSFYWQKCSACRR